MSEFQNLSDEKHADVLTLNPIRVDHTSVFDSKLGGVPYMPQGFQFPYGIREDYAAKPLRFLAQLNFASLPHIDGFPVKGILQFFCSCDEAVGTYGLDFNSDDWCDQNGFRIIYHPDVEDDESLLLDESAIPSYDEEIEFPFEGEFLLEPSDDPDAHTQIGGEAYFTQFDPRPDSKYSNHTVTLFQLDSKNGDDGGFDIIWGDVGVANFFIEPEKLKNCDFSRVMYNWDCC